MNKYNTKYSSGFTNEEIKRLESYLPSASSIKEKLLGCTCSMEDNELINYHSDVVRAIRQCVREYLVSIILEESRRISEGLDESHRNSFGYVHSPASDKKGSLDEITIITESILLVFQREQKINIINE
jgi:hypothetical protein